MSEFCTHVEMHEPKTKFNMSYYTGCGDMLLNLTPDEYTFCPLCGKKIKYEVFNKQIKKEIKNG